MPYNAGGAWVPAPGVSYWPRPFPGAEPVPMSTPTSRATTPPAPAAAAQARRRVVTGADWGPSTLDGPRVLNVGGRRFRIPRTAQVKTSKRSGTAWVRTDDGLVHVLSESGMLIQSDAEKASTPWSLL
jgi:hypothetical protein